VATSNNIDPREIRRKYGVVICQKGPLDFTSTLATIVIRLFGVIGKKGLLLFLRDGAMSIYLGMANSWL